MQKERPPAWIPDKEYEMVREHTPLPHVDLVFLRLGGRKLEVLLFDRLTKPWKGNSCLIGGRQWKGERLSTTIARQAAEVGHRIRIVRPFKSDFPAYVDSTLDQDPLKQATTMVYPVLVAGQGPEDMESGEVSNPRWVRIDKLPENIIPHHKNKILRVVERLERFREIN